MKNPRRFFFSCLHQEPGWDSSGIGPKSERSSLVDGISIDENDDITPSVVILKGTAVEALFAFEPTKSDELGFPIGATIVVLETPSGGWWKGVIGMQEKTPVTGWFPANLVAVKQVPLIVTRADMETVTSKIVTNVAEALVVSPISMMEKKTSWFKRMRSVQTNILETESEKRARSSSAPVSNSDPRNVVILENTLTTIEGSKDLLVESPELQTIGESILPFSGWGGFFRKASEIEEKDKEKPKPVESRQSMFLQASSKVIEALTASNGETLEEKVGSSVFKNLAIFERKRLSVVWELLQTERDYVRDLAITIEVIDLTNARFS